MKIAIIGTRGIPNHYGGFEQFAEYLSLGLVERGHHATVYNSHLHPYQGNNWNGVEIIHCKDLEDKIGTAGQFFYDLNCILDTRKRDFDLILQLGYTSSSIWGWLLPMKKSKIVTNMDGLEWKRSKFSRKVQKFLLFAERLAIKYSHLLISDSIGIQEYFQNHYHQSSAYIPYGAHLFKKFEIAALVEYDVKPYQYNMLIARLEPENSIEIILDGVVKSKSQQDFLVIGNHKTKFGAYLKDKFKAYPFIRFIGGIYNIGHLNNLRHFSKLYFHGHTVGGTNPSLLEAMASQSLICAHNNIFNRSILNDEAYYFDHADDVAGIIQKSFDKNNNDKIIANELKITEKYSWPIIIAQYISEFELIFKK